MAARAGLITGRRIDGRGACLFPPGQSRGPSPAPPASPATAPPQDCCPPGSSAPSSGACASTITRWHQLGLIDTAGTDHRGHPLCPARPAAAHPRAGRRRRTAAACRTRRPPSPAGSSPRGWASCRLSTVYKWHRLGLIDAVTTDNRGRHLYQPGQQTPRPWQVTARTSRSSHSSRARTRKTAGPAGKGVSDVRPPVQQSPAARETTQAAGTVPSRKNNCIKHQRKAQYEASALE